MRFVTIGLAIGLALAVPAAVATAAIYSPEQQLPGPTIAEFKADPSSLLKSFPNGGTDMSTRIRDILATDPTTLAAIVNLLKTADAANGQLRGVATGLAQATILARQTTQNLPFGTEITDAMVAANNKTAYDIYAQLIGDAPIGAGAGAGGGGAGSGGGGPNSSSGIVTGGTSTTPQAAPITSRANTAPGSSSVGFSAASTGASAVTSATQ